MEEPQSGFSGSDSDAEENQNRQGELTKEDAGPDLYDPLLDDRDEVWVSGKRQGRKSDAVLSCPCCFTTLCIDCQRHELYVNQYRAMFVLNCRVVENEILRRKHKVQVSRRAERKARAWGREAIESSSQDDAEEIYKPVKCAQCDADVAMLDQDEVYHFINVLPSYS